MAVLGFDTSNYTTSVASFDGTYGVNESRLLDVELGSLGLRQSEALFNHVKRLPEMTDRLFSNLDIEKIEAIGVSTRPRAVNGSYMPCFLVGESQARVLGTVLNVPVYDFSHQQGHIAASVWTSGHHELFEQPHLAWHLSGGTTELLYVSPTGVSFNAEKIGGTTDISAGQLIDRTGKLLELSFPSGKLIDELSSTSKSDEMFRVKVNDTSFSLSGVENKVNDFYRKTKNCEDTARYAVKSLIDAIVRATKNALVKYPNCIVCFAGGVASNSYLRESTSTLPAVFCPAKYSTDNALGIAILAWRALHESF